MFDLLRTEWWILLLLFFLTIHEIPLSSMLCFKPAHRQMYVCIKIRLVLIPISQPVSSKQNKLPPKPFTNKLLSLWIKIWLRSHILPFYHKLICFIVVWMKCLKRTGQKTNPFRGLLLLGAWSSYMKWLQCWPARPPVYNYPPVSAHGGVVFI